MSLRQVVSIQKQLQKLKSQQQKSQQSEDFILVDCSETPIGQVLSFLSTKSLGPAGLALADALYLSRPLTDNQLDLLQKVLDKMGHPEYMEVILQEISDLWTALGEVDKLCKTSALGMK